MFTQGVKASYARPLLFNTLDSAITLSRPPIPSLLPLLPAKKATNFRDDLYWSPPIASSQNSRGYPLVFKLPGQIRSFTAVHH